MAKKTRVRFRLKDESKAYDEIVKNLEVVISVVHCGGEFMTVIGEEVEEVCNAVCAQLGIHNGVGSEAVNDERCTNNLWLLPAL